MNTSETAGMHLSGPVLEAIAAGETPESADRVHLEECTACRSQIDALREENRVFSAELSIASTQENPMTAATSNISQMPAQSHKPLALYAAAASIMIVAALGLIAMRRVPVAPQPENDLSLPAAAAHKDAQDTPKADDKADNPKPKPEQSPANGEALYEGKSTAQWLSTLSDGGFNQPQIREKALHALKEIGRDGLPQILAELRKTEQPSDAIYSVLRQLDVTREDLPQFTELMKDSNFAVRKAGVQLFKNLGVNQPGLIKDIQAALSQALNDRDKAVAEAAREALQSLAMASLVKDTMAAIQSGRLDDAQKMIADAAVKGAPSAELDKLKAAIQDQKQRDEELLITKKREARLAQLKAQLAAYRQMAAQGAMSINAPEITKTAEDVENLEIELVRHGNVNEPKKPAAPSAPRKPSVGEGNVDE